MDVETRSRQKKLIFSPDIAYDVVIIGAGSAGISCALMAHERGLRALLIEEAVLCSNLYNVPSIEDCPFLDFGRISGHEVAAYFVKRFLALDLEILYEKVVAIHEVTGRLKHVLTSQRTVYARSVVVACGMSNKKVIIRNSQKFYGRGVSYCAPCDIAFYLKQPVMITGLGENLVKAALYLSGYAKHVYVVTRSSLIQGAATLVRDVMKEPKITFYLESEVERLDGKEKLESIRIYKNGDHSESVLDVSVLFIYEAIEGNADFLDSSPGIEVTDELLVRTGVTMQTGVAGIYAIGGVREGGGKRLIVAVSDALVAVNHIQNYLYFLK